jgi:hypothetical protein
LTCLNFFEPTCDGQEIVPCLLRKLFDWFSSVLREFFGNLPKPPRSGPEAVPKESRSRPEAVPKRTRSRLEADPKPSRSRPEGISWTFRRQPSTVNCQPSTVNRQPSPVNRQPFLIAGATCVPNNSIECMICACGMVPTLT